MKAWLLAVLLPSLGVVALGPGLLSSPAAADDGGSKMILLLDSSGSMKLPAGGGGSTRNAASLQKAVAGYDPYADEVTWSVADGTTPVSTSDDAKTGADDEADGAGLGIVVGVLGLFAAFGAGGLWMCSRMRESTPRT